MQRQADWKLQQKRQNPERVGSRITWRGKAATKIFTTEYTEYTEKRIAHAESVAINNFQRK
jgi:hypothetical protein